MATGSGKTFTSVVALYRLIRFAGASMRTSMSLLERREFAARQPGPRTGYELATLLLIDRAPEPDFSWVFAT
jgi:hypothetical protein